MLLEGGVTPSSVRTMEASLLMNPIDADEQKRLLSSLSDDLSFMWDDALVPLEIQARMAQMGFLQLDVWAKAESSETKRAFVIS